MSRIPEIVLNSGWRMPVLGMGTASDPIQPKELVESSIVEAIELGYRHFDTASLYQSEEPLGRAISEAIQKGLIASRNELFITSKLWCTDAHHDLVVPALQKSLQTLGLEYLDLYLIHWPVRLKGKITYDVSKEDLIPFDIRGTWEAMEMCQRLGLARSIGVSNFSSKKLSELLSHATISPAVNQVEMHPYWQQKDLREFCAKYGIHVSAFSPLGGKSTSWGSDILINSEEIKQIGQAKGKSTAQVSLRWAFEQGVSFVPKSFNKGRMKENMEIFDWQLSEDELQKISCLPQGKIYSGHHYVSPQGQYKSVAELWDCEMC